MTKNNRNLRETDNHIIGLMPQGKLRAFTLAEVLITLVIIGVVSVLVLPTIINKVQGYANKRAHQVFYKKLQTSLQLMQGANALAGYQTTEQFVEQFKKYIKIAKVCDNDHLTECFAAQITQQNGKIVNTENGLTIKNFLGNDISDIVETEVWGIILQDGTNILLSYNTNCTNTAENSMTPNMGCLSMVYDTNGGGKPNKLWETVSGFNLKLDTKEDNSNLSKIKDIGQLNAPFYGEPLVEERDFLTPVLSANGTVGGNTFAVFSDGNTNSWGAAYKAFQGTSAFSFTSSCYSADGTNNYIGWYNPNPMLIPQYTIRDSGTDIYSYFFRTGSIEYSDDGINWTKETDVSSTNSRSGQTWTFTVATPVWSKYKRLVIYTDSSGSHPTSRVYIAEITFNNAKELVSLE